MFLHIRGFIAAWQGADSQFPVDSLRGKRDYGENKTKQTKPIAVQGGLKQLYIT